MKRIEFPTKVATLPVTQRDGEVAQIPLPFPKFLRDILSESAVFNGRAGARCANKIQDAMEAAGPDATGLTLDDEWIALLREAVAPGNPAIWASPVVAQLFERHGYYDAIECAKEPGPKIVTNRVMATCEHVECGESNISEDAGLTKAKAVLQQIKDLKV